MGWIAHKSEGDRLMAMDDLGDVWCFKNDPLVDVTIQKAFTAWRCDPEASPRERELAAQGFLAKLLADPFRYL